MGVVLTIAGGLILWVILWSLGVKGFDGGMLFLVIALMAGATRGVAKLLPGNQDETQANPDPAPFT